MLILMMLLLLLMLLFMLMLLSSMLLLFLMFLLWRWILLLLGLNVFAVHVFFVLLLLMLLQLPLVLNCYSLSIHQQYKRTRKKTCHAFESRMPFSSHKTLILLSGLEGGTEGQAAEEEVKGLHEE